MDKNVWWYNVGVDWVEACFEPEWVQTAKRIIQLNLLNEHFHLSPYSLCLMFFVVINYKSPKADLLFGSDWIMKWCKKLIQMSQRKVKL